MFSRTSPVDTFCSYIGVDPTKFLMDDVKEKQGARWLEPENFAVSGWVGLKWCIAGHVPVNV